MKRSTQPPAGYKRLNINIDSQLLNRFKAAAAMKGITMSDVLVEFIQRYVDTHGPGKRPKKAR
jgi:antitoxin component of RelBE/YafQ-DinJ toxin-antitoxin module